MSRREIDRADIVRRAVEGRLTHAKAGQLIGLSERQVRRLCVAFAQHGPPGLISKKRGRASNYRLPQELQDRAVVIVREQYSDFGSTFAAEKLAEVPRHPRLEGDAASVDGHRRTVADACTAGAQGTSAAAVTGLLWRARPN
jgi:hypothetical protein